MEELQSTPVMAIACVEFFLFLGYLLVDGSFVCVCLKIISCQELSASL